MKLIYDCDNTMGMTNKDIDDGLTLLYLYQKKEVELLGTSLTFGNGTVSEVFHQSKTLKNIFNLDVKFYCGAEKHEFTNSPSDAAQFLIDSIKRYPNQVTILATGSLQNLADAGFFYPKFFEQVKEIFIMGGIFSPLKIKSHSVEELNLSIAPQASLRVLHSSAEITLISGQFLVNAPICRSTIRKYLGQHGSKESIWITNIVNQWMDFNLQTWDLDGFINWDGLTALCILEPQFFNFENAYIDTDETNIQQGRLKVVDAASGFGKCMNLVKGINNISEFNKCIFKVIDSYFN